VYFDSSIPHAYQCQGKKPAGAIIVTLHQSQGAVPLRAVNAKGFGKSVGGEAVKADGTGM
jgi:hypothetical protein